MPSISATRTANLAFTDDLQSREVIRRAPLTSEHVDIWEHAALLYRGFEWQASADAFRYLAQSIGATKERTVCLLNAGMILLRLGDVEDALGVLNAAASSNDGLVIGSFLLGLAEHYSDNILMAGERFQACLEYVLERKLEGYDASVSWLLTEDHLRHNLAGCTTHGDADVGDKSLVAICADFLFESPPRDTCEPEPKRVPRMLIRSRKLTESRPRSFGSGRSQEDAAGIRDSRVESDSSRSNDLNGTTRPSDKNRLSSLPPASSAPYDRRSGALQTQNVPHTRLPSRRPSSWHGRPRTPYTPRDARGEYGSMRELAQFIRRYRHQAVPLSPRDARVEYESTRELARFISQSRRHPPLGLQAERDLEDSLHHRSECSTGEVREVTDTSDRIPTTDLSEPPRELKVNLSRSSQQSAPSFQAAPAQSSGVGCGDAIDLTPPRYSETKANDLRSHSISADAANDAAYKLLPATTYKPTKIAKPTSHRTSPTASRTKQCNKDGTFLLLPELHTAPSSTSSLFGSTHTADRAIVARDEALRVLEGRERCVRPSVQVSEAPFRSRRPLPLLPPVSRFDSCVPEDERQRIASSQIFAFPSKR